MTIDEMIAVLQGRKEGKPVQKRLIVGMALANNDPGPKWECMRFDCFNFNFVAYEYRLKPEPREFYVNPTIDHMYTVGPSSSPPFKGWIKVREVLE